MSKAVDNGARYDTAELPGGSHSRVYLWCAWKAAPYRRAPDFAGLVGSHNAGVAAGKRALGDLGAEAKYVHGLATPCAKAYLANGNRVTIAGSDGWDWFITIPPSACAPAPKPAPKPRFYFSVYRGAEGATWCVWEGTPASNSTGPVAHGFIRESASMAGCEYDARAAARRHAEARERKAVEVGPHFAQQHAERASSPRVETFYFGAFRSSAGRFEWALWPLSSAALAGREPSLHGFAESLEAAFRQADQFARDSHGARVAWLGAAEQANAWRVFDGRKRRDWGEAIFGERPAGPSAASVLGVKWPCSRADVLAAYKRKAFETHPDRGGTDAAFIAAGRARDELLRAIGGSA